MFPYRTTEAEEGKQCTLVTTFVPLNCNLPKMEIASPTLRQSVACCFVMINLDFVTTV